MKIATYNVNGINGRLPVLLRWLQERKPDIACLQEIKCPNEKFPELALLDIGYKAVWHGQKSWNGVAILIKKKYEFEDVIRGLPGNPLDDHSRYIQSKINGIIIGCIYLPNGNPAPGPKFDYKMAWFKRLNTLAKKLLKLKSPVILLGDYNVVPTDLDAYKPERWVNDAVFFPEPKAAYKSILKQGWIDSIRYLHPDKKIFTYWDYFRNAFNRDAGIRMDHILLSPGMEKLLKKAEVDRHVRGWEKTSDHAPVWIELKDK
ncbi:MAG: xth [Bacteroidetes bacterium]|jgi:exodeoxyribonuclease-3|nr:xth [Bacteroidota bacterium]